MPKHLAMSARTAAARGVCGSLEQACHDRRIHPLGHPAARASVQRLAAALAAYGESWGALELEIREHKLTLDGDLVHEGDSSPDDPAFLMFRDGMRMLRFHPGWTLAEVQDVVDCLAGAEDLPALDHDLVTALWERDLRRVEYQVSETHPGDGSYADLAERMREVVAQRLEWVEGRSGSSGVRPETRMRRVRARSYDDDAFRLTREEIERAELAAGALGRGARDYAEVLLEMADKLRVKTVSDPMIRALAGALGELLDERDLAGALLVLEGLERAETASRCPRGSVASVAATAVTPGRLARLLQASGRGPAGHREMERFLPAVRKWISPSLLEILTETGDRKLRKTVLDLLTTDRAVSWHEVEPLLNDPRWYVVRNAVLLAAAMGHEKLSVHAARLLMHPDARVRRETVRALARMSGEAALRGLAQALGDPDPSARTLAANALARKGGEEYSRLLRERIEDRTFFSLSPEEMEAFLGAYATLGQGEALPLLQRCLKKSLLSERPLPFRVACVLALGKIHGRAAAAALQAAATSEESQIRQAAAEAVQRAAAPAAPSAAGEP